MEFKKSIEKYKKKIDKQLRIFLQARIKRSASISPSIKKLMENILEFNMRGGKRIRPMLVIMGYIAAGGKQEKEIIKAAVSIELMESFLLVHDDIMDQDHFRRGGPTMHKIYEKECSRCPPDERKRYSESCALVAGDILASLGSEALLGSGFPAELKIKAIDKFNKAIINTCFGQFLDIRAGTYKKITEADIRRLYELKTAIYTFEAPLHIGAILAGADDKVLKGLSKYALPLGKAFQLQDDVLGLFSTYEKIGKPVGSDIREGKKTLLIMNAIKKSSKEEKAFIETCLGNKAITKRDILKIKDIIRSSRALRCSDLEAKSMALKAKNNIMKTGINDQGKRFLSALADYVIKREH